MTPISSKQKLFMSLTGIAFMVTITQLPASPIEEITQTQWIIWGIGMGLLLGAATRSGCKVAYQWSYQRERKKHLQDRSR